MLQNMTGAVIAGVTTALFGVPGLVFGLLIAFVYYGRSRE